jgi:hypothetical protein
VKPAPAAIVNTPRLVKMHACRSRSMMSPCLLETLGAPRQVADQLANSPV